MDKLFSNQPQTYIKDYTDRDMKENIEKLNREQKLDDNETDSAGHYDAYGKWQDS